MISLLFVGATFCHFACPLFLCTPSFVFPYTCFRPLFSDVAPLRRLLNALCARGIHYPLISSCSSRPICLSCISNYVLQPITRSLLRSQMWRFWHGRALRPSWPTALNHLARCPKRCPVKISPVGCSIWKTSARQDLQQVNDQDDH